MTTAGFVADPLNNYCIDYLVNYNSQSVAYSTLQQAMTWFLCTVKVPAVRLRLLLMVSSVFWFWCRLMVASVNKCAVVIWWGPFPDVVILLVDTMPPILRTPTKMLLRCGVFDRTAKKHLYTFSLDFVNAGRFRYVSDVPINPRNRYARSCPFIKEGRSAD